MDGFTEKLQRMYQSGDLTEIAEICAEEQVAVYRRELDTLRSYGLTKRLRADTATAKSGKPPEPFFVQTTDGKNDLSYTNGQVPYVEEFHAGKKRVARFRHRHGLAEIRAVRVQEQHRERSVRRITCNNCGDQVELRGQQSQCPSCRAQFRHEIFSWLITSFRLWNEPLHFRLNLLVGGLFLLGVLLGVGAQWAVQRGLIDFDPGTIDLGSGLEITTGPAAFVVFAVAGAITLVLLAVFVMAVRQAIQLLVRHGRVQQIKRRDPHFSKQSLDLIANRVLDNDPSWLGEPGPDETLLNGGTFKTYVADYRAESDHERVTLKLYRHRYRFRRDRRGRGRVDHDMGRLELPLVRSWQVRTPVYYVPTQYSCPSCGSRQAIVGLLDQECAHCGNANPLAELDWAPATHRASG
ncbi:MAG: hypothetical protein GXX86_01035 [Propionibacterium sp.]|nr:hypothetical protein [Propionibacterium sp.]